MKSKTHYIIVITLLFTLLFLGIEIASAQYPRNYNQSYNQGNQYGNPYSGGYSGGNYGSNSGGMNRSFGGGFGGSFGNSGSFGSSSRFGGGFGNMGSMGGRSSRRSSRGGRSSYGNQGYGSYGGQSYGNTGYGRNSGYSSGYGNQSSNRRSSRFSNSGSNYSGIIPQSSGGQTGSPGQTAPSGTSTERRRALAGKNTRGALSPGGGQSRGGDTNISIQGNAPAGRTVPGGGRTQPGRAGAKRGKPASKKPEAKLRSNATLYLDSPGQMAVIEEPYTVDVKLANPNSLGYNAVGFTIKYNPRDLLPVQGIDENGLWLPADIISIAPDDDSEKKEETVAAKSTTSSGKEGSPFLSDKIKLEVEENSVDTEEGLIRFSSGVQNETNTDSGLVGRVTFVPLRKTDHSSIDLVFTHPKVEVEEDTPLTFLTMNGVDQLGTKFDPADGVVSMDISIYDSWEEAPKRSEVRRADELGIDEEGGEYGTHLYLVTRQEEVDVGDTFDVDVYLSNPNKEAFDSLSLLLLFNPRVLEPIDLDDVNSGINILDEEYRQEYPFDFPVMNSVDAEKGVVDYRKRAYRKPIRGEGVLATIRFQAVRPTTETKLRILVNDAGEDPTSGIYRHGKDRLGDSTDPFDGFTATEIAIRATTAYLKKLDRVTEF